MTGLRVGLALVALTLAACVTDTRPEACDQPEITIELALTATSLTPTNPTVCIDQQVALVITSDVDGTFHIHGYDAAVPATAVEADEELTLRFVAGGSGQFVIEMHAANDPEGVEVGIFTVHEQ